jgi:signal transduction histidine kinase
VNLAPRSLFSRLVLVQLSVLLIALLTSFGIHMHERGEELAQASGMQAAQRIADIVRLLDPLSPAERLRIVQAFSAPPLTISLDQKPLQPHQIEGGARSALFGAVLQRLLGGERRATVAVNEDSLPVPYKPHGAPPLGKGPPADYPGMGTGTGMHFGAKPGLAFVAQVQLKDGVLIRFESRQSAQTTGWPYRLLASLAVLLLAVVAVSLLAVRWATRPLKALADAADELGRNPDRPPMPEQGPVEVVRAAHAFNTMQQRLTRYVRERAATLAAMSHDLKTPLNRLRLRAELLDDSEVKDKISRDLAEVEAMVQSTLEFMRGGESSEKTQPLDVMALVESLAADAQDIGGTVAVEGATARPYVGRPQAMKRCLGNLLDNALKYAGAVSILVEDDEDRLVIRLRDNGPGIPEAVLERVFEPFFRVEGSRNRDTGGTGLGLSIARNIAQLHGGNLILRNRNGGGLEAILTLPR